MNTALTVAPQQALPPSLLMDENELMEVLETSLYRGAKRSSIKMVVGYCKAQRLDPMQKPVHIVPVNTKVPANQPGGRDRWEWVDTVWPGINLYRTNAARSGRHAGTSEPEFGPTITRTFHIPPREGTAGPGKDVEVSFPEWCRVVVKRVLDNGVIAEFPAREFWLENYATVGNYSDAPNAMWTKRPSGQLAKCAEAQALRKAFPESCSAPTAEEMEGKTIDEDGNVVRGARAANPNAVSDDVLDTWLKKARDAKTDPDCVKVYQEGLAVLAKDISAAAEFKRTVLDRRQKLRQHTDSTVSDAEPKSVSDRQPADEQRGEESQEQQGGGPVKTLAQVVDLMAKAAKLKDADALDIAADWVSAIPEEHRAEATAKYEEFKREIQGAAHG